MAKCLCPGPEGNALVSEGQGPFRQPQCLRCGSAADECDDEGMSCQQLGRQDTGHSRSAVSFNRGRTDTLMALTRHVLRRPASTSPRTHVCGQWRNRMPRGAVSNEGQQARRREMDRASSFGRILTLYERSL